jgi:hypothetical protein
MVDPAYKPGKLSKRGRTGQIVVVEPEGLQVDERAEFGGDRPCQRKCTVFFSEC